VVTCTATVLVAVGGFQVRDLLRQRAQALQAAEARASNLAYVLTEYVRGSFGLADTTLRQLAIHAGRVGGAAAPDAFWTPLLRSAIAALPGGGSISVTSADGVIRHSTHPHIVGESRAAQFLFKRLSIGTRDELIVDTPFPVDNPPRYVLPLGRRLVTANGRFDGVVALTVGPETFRQFFRSVDLGPEGIVSVIHPEGQIVFREPSEVDPLGRTVQNQAVFQAARAAPGRGVVVAPLQPGGPAFISAYQTIETPPLIVAVSLSRAGILSDWWSQLRTALLAFGALTATLAGIVLVLFRQMDARRKVEQELTDIQRIESIQLRESNERLESALEREQRARRETEEASRLKDQFLMTLSHELRTPLTAIYGWVRMLSSNILPADQQARALAAVERNARAQTRLIDDLLDVSRAITGKLRIDPRPIGVTDVVLAAIETLEPALDARNLRLEKSLDRDAGQIVADPDRVQQIIWNLLSNAIKFTPEGGSIQIRTARMDGTVEIAVRDSGIGIAPEFIPFIFERFHQADVGTRRRFGGLGLGLAIVRHLVELHGGTVAVESRGEGSGATFRVMLPIRAVAPQAAQPQAAGGGPAIQAGMPARLDGIRVLVVDDEPDARELFTSILETAGAAVVTAASAAEALRSLERERADVLLSDIEMPDRDGYELLARVAGSPRNSQLVTIAVTAYARSVDRKRALDAGFDHHLAKPVEPAELVSTIAALVGARSQGAASSQPAGGVRGGA
jgi:signal transduction histidine kinase/ActR/RegA family two-component response regulator